MMVLIDHEYLHMESQKVENLLFGFSRLVTSGESFSLPIPVPKN